MIKTDRIIGYHGTNVVFQSFKCPCYFADNYKTAEFFAERAAGSSEYYGGKNNIPIILKCDLIFENPLIVDLHGQQWGSFFLDDVKLHNMKFYSRG